jgi:hypothetical protein
MSQRKDKIRKTSEKMKGLCFIISLTGLNKPNTEKDDDDDDDDDIYFYSVGIKCKISASFSHLK